MQRRIIHTLVSEIFYECLKVISRTLHQILLDDSYILITLQSIDQVLNIDEVNLLNLRTDKQSFYQ